MPIGKGNRVVKPPTVAQRAQAQAFNTGFSLPPKSDDAAPASSWWTDPKALKTRAAFDNEAAAQRTRMAESKFGQILHVTAVG